MNREDIKKELIKLVEEDSNEALGCTELVSLGCVGNEVSKYINPEEVEEIGIITSRSLYKNAKSVRIPIVQDTGMELTVLIGMFSEPSDKPFLIFANTDDTIINKARNFLNNKKVNRTKFEDTDSDIYIRFIANTIKDSIEILLKHSHTHIERVIKNGEVVLENNYSALQKDEGFDIKSLTFQELRKIIDDMSFDELSFTLAGIKTNLRAVDEGLKGYGLNLGRTLNELKEKNVLPDNFITNARIMTAAASDMRMGGGTCPVMTSGGSGNQGIGVILSVYSVAKEERIDDERLAKSLFFAHVINRYVKQYAGKLSGMCGCAIGSAIGATASIVYMLGGDDNQIAGACANIYANLTGLLCDGAKGSCAMKLATCAEESIVQAYLSLNGVITDSRVGVVGETIEDTIFNIGKLSRQAFTCVDEVVLNIIENQ